MKVNNVNLVLGGFILGIGIGGWWGWSVSLDSARSLQSIQTLDHPLCHGDKKREAWVASKDGILRCFLEYKEYPHRVRAAHIE